MQEYLVLSSCLIHAFHVLECFCSGNLKERLPNNVHVPSSANGATAVSLSLFSNISIKKSLFCCVQWCKIGIGQCSTLSVHE